MLTIEFAVIISAYVQWRISLQGVMPNFLTTLYKLYELKINVRYELPNPQTLPLTPIHTLLDDDTKLLFILYITLPITLTNKSTSWTITIYTPNTTSSY